jgi:hypothetical protein
MTSSHLLGIAASFALFLPFPSNIAQLIVAWTGNLLGVVWR